MSTHDLPAPRPAVWPSVGFTDVDAGTRFLTDVLGFVVTALHREDDGTVVHGEARRPDGDGGVMFGSRGKTGDWGALGAAGVYVVAPDAAGVEAAWQRAQAAGVEVLTPLHATDYDPATFAVRDNDGNLWSMGTYLGE
ncbi:glyoxalase [Georgenia wutianyii]|uniref:Glyoxalase n=1 Tax=Georgenia wutianyii TaxID=2585135 RepID=A0ABX5VMZ9_9MICO|nr:VOC family protein [Georgenia wutianyii]QDB79867.1 glyoxalase [Georgenia wutianyii]